MPKLAPQVRILFVTPEVTFIPHYSGNAALHMVAHKGGFSDRPERLIVDLYDLGVDVHVAQPDYRGIFTNISEEIKCGIEKTIPADRVHLTEDRAFYYSNYTDSNPKWENIKISLAFQREIFNYVIPETDPDLLHCHDWMTGLIPAMAKNVDIPCLFTVQNPETAKCFLSYVEDRGIDAATFWQNLFYDRYPLTYEETRESNPIDFLLSGILSADFVNIASSVFMVQRSESRGLFMEFPFWGLLANKVSTGCAAFNSNFDKTRKFIDIYERMIQRYLPEYLLAAPGSQQTLNCSN